LPRILKVVTYQQAATDRVFAVVDRLEDWQDSLSAAVWIKLESERWIVYI